MRTTPSRHPTKTFIIGTAGSQDPTLQIAPKNMFRYHGDGAQWDAGLGELAYKRLGWRKAAIIMDDYSFGWTWAGGMIADFCAVGGQITKRVFPPLNTTDYAAYVRQLPAPAGRRLLLGGRRERHRTALTAFEQAYGTLDPKQQQGTSSSVSWAEGRGSEARRRLPRYLGHRSRPEDAQAVHGYQAI